MVKPILIRLCDKAACSSIAWGSDRLSNRKVVCFIAFGAAAVTLVALARSAGARAPFASRDALLLPMAAAIPLQQVVVFGTSGALADLPCSSCWLSS